MPHGDATAPFALASGLTREYLLHHRVCPMGHDDAGALVVAAAPDAWLDDALDDLALIYHTPVTFREATVEEVGRWIERLATRTELTIELA